MRSALVVIGLVVPLALVSSPVSAAPAEQLPRQPAQGSFSPYEKSITELAAAMDAGVVSSEWLVRYYLRRIDAYEDRGPTINAIISVKRDALQRARELDQERRKHGPRSVLHGVPVVVKDNIDVKGMRTTGGAAALRNARPYRNADITRRLIDAGAIILAKTNMSELAASYGWLGYSSMAGLTVNPYNLNRNAAGSSSGTAAAVTANFAVFGFGTDTSGSVRAPAATTGLVGIRPTQGSTSAAGVIPLSLSFDATGPMARSVADAAIALTYTTGRDYVRDLDRRSLDGVRVGVPVDFFGGNEEVDDVVHTTIDRLESRGATIVPVSLEPELSKLWETVLGPIGDMEFKNDFERYLRSLKPGAPDSLQEVIEISESEEVQSSPTPPNPARIEGLKVALAESAGDGGPEYRRILDEYVPQVRSLLDRTLSEQDLDVLAFPTMACPASPRFDRPDPTYQCEADDPFNASYLGSVTGYPEVTLTAGTDSHGLPIGISLLGRANSEPFLLGLAYAVERSSGARTPPPTTPELQTQRSRQAGSASNS